MNCVYAPFDEGETFALCVATDERRQAWQRTLSSTVDVRELDNERILGDLEPAQHVGAASFEHKRLIAKHDCFQFFVWQPQDFIDCIALEQNLRHGCAPVAPN